LSYLKAAEPRFLEKVNKQGQLKRAMTSRCWEWQGATDGYYGQFTVTVKGKQLVRYAHVFAWSIKGGPLPTRSFQLHHLCANKLCVNPTHMVMVSQSGHSRLHTFILIAICRNRHVFDEDNPLIDSKGYRRCRECAREAKLHSKGKWRKKYVKKSKS